MVLSMKLFPSIDAAASWLRMPNGQKRSQSHDVVGAVLDDARLGQPPCKLIGACFPEEGGRKRGTLVHAAGRFCPETV